MLSFSVFEIVLECEKTHQKMFFRFHVLPARGFQRVYGPMYSGGRAPPRGPVSPCKTARRCEFLQKTRGSKGSEQHEAVFSRNFPKKSRKFPTKSAWLLYREKFENFFIFFWRESSFREIFKQKVFRQLQFRENRVSREVGSERPQAGP